MHSIEEKTVGDGDLDIIVTAEYELKVRDNKTGELIDITDDYVGEPVDKSIFTRVENRARSGELFVSKRGRGELLSFLKDSD